MSTSTADRRRIEGRIWLRIDSDEGDRYLDTPSIPVCVASRLSKEPGAVQDRAPALADPRSVPHPEACHVKSQCGRVEIKVDIDLDLGKGDDARAPGTRLPVATAAPRPVRLVVPKGTEPDLARDAVGVIPG